MKPLLRSLARLGLLLALSVLALQIYFAARIAMMAWTAPQSTSFERSEAWRLAVEKHEIAWSQQWVDGDGLSRQLKRAVIASEDASFVDHSGVDWDALEKAWEKNQRAQILADKRSAQLSAKAVKSQNTAKPLATSVMPQAKIVGGSTITQQLAKNLFLSGERHLLRKGQEFLITFMLEGLLGKERILDIYLNHVEWGEGVFGAQAAARHYFRVNANQLSSSQAARLAVMLPAPKRFEKRPSSPYVLSRAATIEARMPAVELP
ncbi:transglycosylase domain-containing protein [Roseateles koreensis]|uniref:Biosynthetic peptidoglycan transglycosylase n=1 Tax=Roseateles koreensis TaxID=2987526 RepID=A0ABT5KP35_9BURK|nr:transglycosylase domain-containing protein [Roseateles koreensis]MDC8784210.1 transglycosylase domain-containing protein [Roseateles koreensis]